MSVGPGELRCNACGETLHYEAAAAVVRCHRCGAAYAVDVSSGRLEPPPYEAEALAWLREGRKKQAVEVVRAHTGISPREAKEYVDELAAGERTAPPRLRSASVAIMLAVLIALALAALFFYGIMAGR